MTSHKQQVQPYGEGDNAVAQDQEDDLKIWRKEKDEKKKLTHLDTSTFLKPFPKKVDRFNIKMDIVFTIIQ